MKPDLSQLILIQAIESSSNHIVITDVDGTIIYANSAVERITGFSVAEVLGNTPSLWSNQIPNENYAELWKKRDKDQKDYVRELINKRKDGVLYTAQVIVSPIRNPNGEIIGFIGTEEDVTLRKEVEQMKDDLISMISHQLRTPTAAISWYSEMLLGDVAGPLQDSQKEVISHIYDSSQRMTLLINSFLSVAVLEAGKFNPTFAETDISMLIMKVVTETKPAVETKSIKITVDASSDLPKPMTDEKHLYVILSNLITNAIKYSPSGAEVILKACVDGNKLTISVTDKGYGIPEENKHKIFEKFFRAKNVTEFESEGTGLGLYLSKKIALALGGDIWFQSAPEQGTTFWVGIPLMLTTIHEAKNEERHEIPQEAKHTIESINQLN